MNGVRTLVVIGTDCTDHDHDDLRLLMFNANCNSTLHSCIVDVTFIGGENQDHSVIHLQPLSHYVASQRSKIDKTDHHDIADMLLKVALNTMTP